MRELLSMLCLADGVSSNEEEIRLLIRKEAEACAGECMEDAIGNLLVFKKGRRTPGKTVMLCAHMDEIGLMVTSVTDGGYLKFATCGGIDPRVLPGKRVRCGENKTPGVIGVSPPHFSKPGEAPKPPAIEELLIDIGASDRQSAEKLVSPGDTCAFAGEFVEFGGFYKCKAIDDRLGCAVMLSLLREDLPVDVWFAFTAQEETGTRGAFSAAHSVKPDLALIIEGTTAADLPGAKGAQRVCSAGGGVVIPFMDNGSIYDRELYRELAALCEKNGLPWQTKSMIAGGTDASAVQRSLSGVRSAGIAAAVRYIHSPSCVASKKDCEDLLTLTRLFLNNL